MKSAYIYSIILVSDALKKLKRRVKFILINWVKYYTKEMFKTLKIVTIGSAIVLTVAFVKYKPVYKVTISGETIGFIDDKTLVERKVEKYINDESGNITFKEIDVLPEYELSFINRDKKTEDEKVMLAVENLTTITYKNYAVTANGETKVIVDSQAKAESIINEIKSDLQEDVGLNLGIIEVYETSNSAVTSENAKDILSEYKVAKVNEYQEKKAEEARIAEAAKQKSSKARSVKTTATSAPTGRINGLALSIPVNGTISSRFGSRSRIRSSAHTGLDIAASLGTGIRPIAPGTVSYAGTKGSYGKLIVIDHGDGIQSYYAHCSELYVSVGQTVGEGTTIAAIGSTGNSTGPHLHLEIRINGKVVNPQNYLY